MLEITTEKDFKKILKDNEFVVIDFGATWCGPCKKIAPKFEKLAEENENIFFAKIDVDTEDLEPVVSKYVKEGIPHFVSFKNGKQVDSLTGASPKDLERLVSDLN